MLPDTAPMRATSPDDIMTSAAFIFDRLMIIIDNLNQRVAELEAQAGRAVKTWHTRQEAAAYLCISTTKLDELRGEGRLVTHHIDGRPIFHVDDLDTVAVPGRTELAAA